MGTNFATIVERSGRIRKPHAPAHYGWREIFLLKKMKTVILMMTGNDYSVTENIDLADKCNSVQKDIRLQISLCASPPPSSAFFWAQKRSRVGYWTATL